MATKVKTNVQGQSRLRLGIQKCSLGYSSCPLAQLCEGDCAILTGTSHNCHFSIGRNIVAAGFLSGVEVKVIKITTEGSCIVEVDGNTYALSPFEASRLQVTKFSGQTEAH